MLDLPRPDWPMARRIALEALIAIDDLDSSEIATGDDGDGVTADVVRMRLLNDDWSKYDDHDEFLAELQRQKWRSK
jgi:hypothetical protein